jgi:hypothetical protein
LKSSAFFLGLFIAAAAVLAGPQQPGFDPNANLKTGPDIGQKVPSFSAVDQTGRVRNFDSLKGTNGLVLFFNRSVDW